MPRRSYTFTGPDGQLHNTSTPDHVEHTVAVFGYMRLRKQLPKVNPNDANEEPTYDRFKAWVLIGTAVNQTRAEFLAKIQGYHRVTEEVRYVPVVGVLNVKLKDADEEHAPVGAVDLDAL